MFQSCKYILIKILLIVFAFQVLNLSIDTVDFTPQQDASYDTFNYFNSLTEYVTEVVLNNVNYFPEYNKTNSSSKTSTLKHFSIKFSIVTPVAFLSKKFVTNAKSYTQLNAPIFSKYCKEITPPPPKA